MSYFLLQLMQLTKDKCLICMCKWVKMKEFLPDQDTHYVVDYILFKQTNYFVLSFYFVQLFTNHSILQITKLLATIEMLNKLGRMFKLEVFKITSSLFYPMQSTNNVVCK